MELLPLEDEDLPEWLRSKMKHYPFFKGFFFGDVDRIFDEMERMMEEEFKTSTSRIPKDYVRAHAAEIWRCLWSFLSGMGVHLEEQYPELKRER